MTRFGRGARIRSFGKLPVVHASPPCVGFTKFPAPSAAAAELAHSHPKKSWARRWLRQRGMH